MSWPTTKSTNLFLNDQIHTHTYTTFDNSNRKEGGSNNIPQYANEPIKDDGDIKIQKNWEQVNMHR